MSSGFRVAVRGLRLKDSGVEGVEFRVWGVTPYSMVKHSFKFCQKKTDQKVDGSES